jgi:hypothetical protein
MQLREIVDLFADLRGIDAEELARSDQALGEFALILWRSGQSLHAIARSVPGPPASGFARVDRLRREALGRERTDSGYRARLEQLTAELAFRVEARTLESRQRSASRWRKAVVQRNRRRLKKPFAFRAGTKA